MIVRILSTEGTIVCAVYCTHICLVYASYNTNTASFFEIATNYSSIKCLILFNKYSVIFSFPLPLRTLFFDTSKLLQCVLTSNLNIYIYLSVSPQVSFGFRCFRRIFVSSYRCHINSVCYTEAKTQIYAPIYRIFYFKLILLIIFISIKRPACVWIFEFESS